MTKCLVPDCDVQLIHLRGLCRNCYTYAASLVFFKLVTWEQMEAAGCCLPATGQRQSPKRAERTAFFATATGMSAEAMSDELRRRTYDYGQRRINTRRIK